MHRSLALLIVAFAYAAPAAANFHLWDVSEVFSNADGNVQFIEFFTTFPGQEFLGGGTRFVRNEQANAIRNSFTFPSNLVVPATTTTANHHFLVATPGLAAVEGSRATARFPWASSKSASPTRPSSRTSIRSCWQGSRPTASAR